MLEKKQDQTLQRQILQQPVKDTSTPSSTARPTTVSTSTPTATTAPTVPTAKASSPISNESSENIALESHFRNKYPVGVGGKTEKEELCKELKDELNSLTHDQMNFLSKSAPFGNIISNEAFVKTAVLSLSPENLGLLAKNAGSDTQAKNLNKLLYHMSPEDSKIEPKLRSIATNINVDGLKMMDSKKIQDAKTNLGDTDKAFKIMLNPLGSTVKNEVVNILNLRVKEANEFRQQETAKFLANKPAPSPNAVEKTAVQSPTAPKTAAPPKPEAAPTAESLRKARNWDNDALQNFVETTLGKEQTLNQLERMDGDSLKRLTQLIGDDAKALNKLWSFEKTNLQSSTSRERRADRLEVIFSNMTDAQIKTSAKSPAFLEVISNEQDKYASAAAKGFSASQMASLAKYTDFNDRARLAAVLHGLPVPKNAEDANGTKDKINAIKDNFFKELSPFKGDLMLNSLESVIRRLQSPN